MLQFFTIVLTVFLLGWIPYASADQIEKTDTQSQSVEVSGDRGV